MQHNPDYHRFWLDHAKYFNGATAENYLLIKEVYEFLTKDRVLDLENEYKIAEEQTAKKLKDKFGDLVERFEDEITRNCIISKRSRDEICHIIDEFLVEGVDKIKIQE